MKYVALILIYTFLGCSNSQSYTGSKKYFKFPECIVPTKSSWNYNEKKLIESTKQIIVARLVGLEESTEFPTLKPDFEEIGGISGHVQFNSPKWVFKVRRALKGNLKKDHEFSFISFEKKDDDTALAVLCQMRLKFELNKEYIVFLDSFNPNGYKSYSKENEQRILKYINN